MRRRDVLRSTAAAAALPLASTAASATGSRTAATRRRASATGSQEAFEPLGFLEVAGTKEVVVDDAGETAYTATTDGFAAVDISDPENPELLARESPLLGDHEDGPLRMVYDVKLDGDTLVAVGPANAIGETVRGVVVFDVSDPASPEQTGVHETDYPIHNAYLEDGVAYLTANDGAKNPAVLVDVGGDAIEEVSRWSNVDYDDAWRDVPPFVRACHDIYVQDGTMYVAYWDAGTWLVDVSDPANPEYVTHFGHYDATDLQDVENPSRESLGLPGNSHYVAVDDDASVLASGAEAWDVDPDDDSDGQGGLDLWDVSDPQNPEELSHIAAPPTPDGSRQGTWTTSHNFEFRGDRLYTSWYQGGVKVHDVSDPANPEELAWWRQPEQTRFWTARYATEDAFVAGSMMGGEDYPEGVYVFPNRAGEQPDPPALVDDDSATTTAGATTTEQTTTAPTTEPTTAAPTTTAATTASEDGESGGGVPGFGALAAVTGLSAAALAAWRRTERKR